MNIFSKAIKSICDRIKLFRHSSVEEEELLESVHEILKENQSPDLHEVLTKIIPSAGNLPVKNRRVKHLAQFARTWHVRKKEQAPFISETEQVTQMTFNDLYQLKDLKKEIAEQQRRISADTPPAVRKIINESLAAYWRTYVEVEMFINNIPDSFTRRIFRLRFIDNFTWTKIALTIGGNQTGDSVRKICKRYLQAHAHE